MLTIRNTLTSIFRFLAIWAVGGILLFVGWLMSLIWSIQGEQRAVPWLGDQFQTWFRGF